MSLSAIWTMTRSDLRQRVRDRSVLVFGLAVPFALMLVFDLLFSGFGSIDDLEPVRVAMAGTEDEIGAGLAATLEALGAPGVTVVPTAAPDVAATVEAGGSDLGVMVPDDFTGAVQSGGSPTVEVVDPGDGSIEAGIVTAVVDGFVAQVADASRTATAGARAGLAPDQVAALAAEVAQAPPLLAASVGEVADEQLSLQGGLVAGQAALFMFFTVGFGVIAYLVERDQGTLPRLRSMPFDPRAILVAKTLVSFLLGVGATTVLLVAGSLFFGVDFGAIGPIAVLVVVTVAAATSLVLVVTKVARTSEQASTVNSILALVLGVLGGAFFPIGSGGWLSRLSEVTPPAAFIRGLGITQAGGGVADLAEPLVTVGGFLVLTLFLAAVLPARELQA